MKKIIQNRSTVVSLAGLLVLALAMFGDVLTAGGTRVLGDQGADLVLQYYSWRDFGFHELAKGNLALWNPYIFGGAPFFGGMQSALLYPPNWLFLVLPLAAAINWSVALNLFGLGLFMFLWMRVRGLGAAASFFAGTMLMFSGAHFLHVFAGHLPQMAAMTWAPLIFCAIDGFLKTRTPGWILLGISAVALQILAGFPQYVFYVGIIAGLYSVLRLVSEWNFRTALGLLMIYVGALALTAIQILPAIEATSETVRGARVPFEFAAQCAFPAENFVTLVAPNFFGDVAVYWGRCYLWETSFFVGVTTIALAAGAAIYLDRKTKWIPVVVIFAALLFALGVHTPLFPFLYQHVPGFDRFRATAKFIFPATLFVVLLGASGLDRLLQQGETSKKFVVGLFVLAGLLVLAGFWVASTTSWQSLMGSLQETHESYLRPELYANVEFVARAQHRAAWSVVLAAGTIAAIAILLLLGKRDRRFAYALIALGVIESFCFARGARPTFDSASIIDPQEKAFLERQPGDYRIMNPQNPNSAMSLRVPDIWGYDPNVVRRYAEFMTWTQGGDPSNATLYVKFTRFDPLYALLRLRYVFNHRGNELQTAEAPVPPMPHLQLISNYRVIGGSKKWEWSPPYRDTIFEAMRADTFDPSREVILESEPEPVPTQIENPGRANIIAETTDELTIEADVNWPSILLITDVYTPAWRAVALPGGAQTKYRVMAADYVLRAVPLAAGHHRFRLEYAPRGFAVGKWISIVGAILFVAGVVGCRRRRL